MADDWLAQPTALATNMIALRQQSEHQRALENIQNKFATIAQAEENRKQVEFQKKQEFLKTPWNPQLDPQFNSLWGNDPESAKKGIELLKSMKILDEKGVGTMESQQKAVMVAENNSKIFDEYIVQPNIKRIENEVAQNRAEYEKVKASAGVDPSKKEKVAEALAKWQQSYLTWGSYTKKFGDAMKAVMENERKMDEASQRAMFRNWKVASDPESETGYSYFDLVTGERMLSGAPGPKESSADKTQWKVVADKASPTGYSYQDLNDPTKPLRPGAPKPGAEQTGMQLNPDTLRALADRFGVTGEVPGMGMGRAATEARTKVLNQWAEDLKTTGQTAQDQVAKQAAYKASKQELTRLQTQRGSVMAFASTADKNLDLAGELSDRVGRTGVPVVNRWLLAGKRSITGDVDVARFDAAIRTAINEYARVTSSVTGGGVTSDTARKEVESMLNAAQTPAQVKGVIQTLKSEMANRKAGYDEQIEFIKNSLAGKTPQATKGNKIGRFTVEVE